MYNRGVGRSDLPSFSPQVFSFPAGVFYKEPKIFAFICKKVLTRYHNHGTINEGAREP